MLAVPVVLVPDLQQDSTNPQLSLACYLYGVPSSVVVGLALKPPYVYESM